MCTANKVHKAYVCIWIIFCYCSFNSSGLKVFIVVCLYFQHHFDFLKIYSLAISSCMWIESFCYTCDDLFVLIFVYNSLDFGPDVLIVYAKWKYVFNSVAFICVFLEIVSLLSTCKYGVHELGIYRQTHTISVTQCLHSPTFFFGSVFVSVVPEE